MHTEPIHRTISDDGTQIVGRVHGQGPPLVLVPGGPGDGEFSFRFLVPPLAGSMTCHAMSTRGRGLSAGHPDHSMPRLVDDVRAYVDSIGERVTLFGHSSGGVLALEAAVRTDAVSGLVLYEPAVFDVITDEQAAQFADIVARMTEAFEDGRRTEASRIFFEEVALANDEEMRDVEARGVLEVAAPNLPSVLRQVELSGPPRLSDASVLRRIDVPTLVLQGERTHPFYLEAARHVAEQVPDIRLVEIPGAGHLGPQLEATAVAEATSDFLVTAGAAA